MEQFHITDEMREDVAKLRPFDDDFMSSIFKNNIPAAERVLRIILKDAKLKVVKLNVQEKLPNLFGKSIQLDILAEDEHGTKFNVEVQRADKAATPRRARYHSGLIDMNYTVTGTKDYEAIPDTYIIMYCENDYFGYGLPLYTIRRYIQETSNPVNDGITIIYVNGQFRDNSELGYLNQDFAESDPRKMHYKELADRAAHFKYTEEGVIHMCKIMEKYQNRGIEQGIELNSIKVAKTMIADNAPMDKIILYSGLTKEQIEALKSPQAS